MNGADLDHRLARSRVPLVVPAVPPVATQPGEGPLHHIPLGLLHEPHFPRRTADDFDHVPRLRLNQPVVEVMVVVLPVPQIVFRRLRCSAVIRPSISGANVPSSAEATETTTTSSNPSLSTRIC